ncbi:11144_t:CDS:2, partial [Gigaspora rosea]
HKMILVNDGNDKISNPIFYELNVGALSSGKELIGFIDLELIRNHNLQFMKSSDIYSLGYITWSISKNPVDGTPQSYIDLYQKCWRLSSNEQPSAKVLCNQLEIMLQGELLNNLQECPPDEEKILKVNRFRKNLQKRPLNEKKILK